MKRLSILLLALFASAFLLRAQAQKVDSIYFHLYTDSLKKGQHNYINVDGKLSSGQWQPLTSREIEFSCASAKFDGNQLIIPENFSEKKVIVKASLRANPTLTIERTIWIKQAPDPLLPTSDEIMNKSNRKRGRS